MRTTQKEKYRVLDNLRSMGVSFEDSFKLRRISMTLRNWFEMECGNERGCIERDEITGKPRWYNANSRYVQANDPRAYHSIPDRETGAMKRLASIMAGYPELVHYVQTDCRGAALYILSKDMIRDGENIDSIYSRGIAVY